MQVQQIYSLINSVTSEILGASDLLKEDLSNIVDVGSQILDVTNVDNYVKKLVDRIGKVIFVSRPYSGSVPSVLMDSWDFGAVVQKIDTDLPEATENKSWSLTHGTDYSPNVFYKPEAHCQFFCNKVTFEIDMSFTEKQVRESFTSATEVNSFLTMLYNAVDKSFTVKVDGLIMRTINNAIAETLSRDVDGVKAVNLLKLYNTEFSQSLTADKCVKNKDFIRYASYTMGLYIDRLSKLSTLFNVGGRDRFTSKDLLHVVMLSEFKASANTYLQSDVFHNEYTALPNAETVPYWQGSGTKYLFEDTSSVNVTTSSNIDVKKSGILAVMFDRDCLGVSNLEKRVTTNYNPKAEFYNNFYKMECGAFNDLNENCVVFYVEDYTADLTVTSAQGSSKGKTAITVSPEIPSEGEGSTNTYVYKTGIGVCEPELNEICSTGWTAWNGSSDITATTGDKIVIVEIDTSNQAKKSGSAVVVSKP